LGVDALLRSNASTFSAFPADLRLPGLPKPNCPDITLAMKKLTIIIEKTKDLYSAYADNMEGIYGGGNTIQEAKASIKTSIKLYEKHNNLKPQDYEITYLVKPT
jgi:predicted RNase H-like HicB family nuclease